MRSQVHVHVIVFFFSWGGGGGGGGGGREGILSAKRCDNLIITHIKRGIVFLSTVLPIDDYQGVTCEPVHEISNNVVCATSKAPEQPAHTRSLIRAFTSRLSVTSL